MYSISFVVNIRCFRKIKENRMEVLILRSFKFPFYILHYYIISVNLHCSNNLFKNSSLGINVFFWIFRSKFCRNFRCGYNWIHSYRLLFRRFCPLGSEIVRIMGSLL